MTEPIRCAVCANYTFKDAEKASIKAGLGHCALGPAYIHPNPYTTRECGTFKQVAEADLPARIKWEKQGT